MKQIPLDTLVEQWQAGVRSALLSHRNSGYLEQQLAGGVYRISENVKTDDPQTLFWEIYQFRKETPSWGVPVARIKSYHSTHVQPQVGAYDTAFMVADACPMHYYFRDGLFIASTMEYGSMGGTRIDRFHEEPSKKVMEAAMPLITVMNEVSGKTGVLSTPEGGVLKNYKLHPQQG